MLPRVSLRSCLSSASVAIRDDDGAVSVEWVVLSSAVIVLVLLIGQPVFSSAFDLVDEIALEIMAVQVGGS